MKLRQEIRIWKMVWLYTALLILSTFLSKKIIKKLNKMFGFEEPKIGKRYYNG